MIAQNGTVVNRLEGLKYFEEFKTHKLWGISKIIDKEKVPLTPNGTLLYWEKDPSTLSQYKQIEKKCTEDEKCLPAILLKEDLSLIFVDLDNVRDPVTEAVSLWASDLIRDLDTYTEISRNGTGFHMFLRGNKPNLEKGKARCQEIIVKGATKKKDEKFELYDRKRLATITGDVYVDKPIREITEAESLKLYRQFFPRKTKHKGERKKTPPMSDERVLELIRKSKRGATFEAIMSGDTLGETDESTVDFKLFGIVAFYTQDVDQIIRIVWNSERRRIRMNGENGVSAKWNRESYVRDSIENAIEDCGSYYGSHKGGSDTQDLPLESNFAEIAKKIVEDKNPCADFDITRLPEAIRDHVERAVKVSDAHPLMVTAATISTLSAFAQNVSLGGNVFNGLRPNLYKIVLSKSGSFKSTAITMGCHHLLEHETKVTKVFKETMAEALKDQNKANRESLIESALDRRAHLSRQLATSSTPQQLCVDLSRGHGGLIASGELSVWFTSIEQTFNQGAKQLFTDFYDDKPIPYEIRTRGNEGKLPIIVERPYISIFGVSAPVWLENVLSEKEVVSGFFARFLIFYLNEPFKIPKAYPDGNFEPSSELGSSIERINNFNGNLTLSKDAIALYEKIHEEMWRGFEGFECLEIYESYLKRWLPAILKVAMLFHLVKEKESTEIQKETILEAAYYINFAVKSTITVLGKGFIGSKFQRNCDWILNTVAANNGKCNLRKLNGNRRWNSADEFYKCVDWLVARGDIQILNPIEPVTKQVCILCDGKE